MSRNALHEFARTLRRLTAVASIVWLAGLPGHAADSLARPSTNSLSRVVSVEDSDALHNFQPNQARVQQMVNRGLTQLTGQASLSAAWHSLVATQDIVGIKVYSDAGEFSGTRPAVVAAVIRGLLDAGLPPQHLIIWDKHAADLRNAGFYQVAADLGVRIAGSADVGYDPTNFYQPETAVIGSLVWGDLEFGAKGDGIGRKSFVTKLVSREITKIISIAPLLNQNDAGVSGHLYSLALGSVDNTRRFEVNPDRLSAAVPEIYALPLLGDRVVLNITDALIGQYEGSTRGLLHYSAVLNQLWFSHDPVALDTLAIKELERERKERAAPGFKPNLDLYANAVLLQLGVDDPARIQVETLKEKP